MIFRNELFVEFSRVFRFLACDPEVPADVVATLAQLNAQLDAAMSSGLPMAWSSPAQSTHSVHNLDTFPMHFYRIEFKRVECDDIIKNGSSFYSNVANFRCN